VAGREALTLFRQSVTLLGEARDRYAQADALWHLGLALDALDERDEADAFTRQALAIFEQLGAPEADEVRASMRVR
jgi:hypothetical protein